MNLFFLSEDPVLCAQQHCNKHVVKMVTETGQILSTVIRQKLGNIPTIDNITLYSSTHSHHPSVLWCGASLSNFRYTLQLFKALSDEYTHRYKKVHATYTKLYAHIIDNLETYERRFLEITPKLYLGTSIQAEHYFFAPPQCVDKASLISKGRGTFFVDKQRMLRYAALVTILAYRNYYRTKKAYFAKWTDREVPAWFTTGDDSDILIEKEAIDQAERVTTRYTKVSMMARKSFKYKWHSYEVNKIRDRHARTLERRQREEAIRDALVGPNVVLTRPEQLRTRIDQFVAEANTTHWEPAVGTMRGIFNPRAVVRINPIQPVDHIYVDIQI